MVCCINGAKSEGGRQMPPLKASKLALSLLDRQCLTIPQLYQLQSHLTVSGAISDHFATGKLIAAFTRRPSAVSHAHQLLLRLPYPTTYMYNSIIKVLAENDGSLEAFSLYKQMVGAGLLPNNYTFSFVIRVCVDLVDLFMGLMVHAQAVKLGWESYDFVQNGLIHVYAVCDEMDECRKLFDVSLNQDVVTWSAVINGYVKAGRVEVARKLFDEMPERNAVSWSTVIAGYAQMGYFKEALELFNDMQVSGVRPNHASIVGALTACASLGALDHGRWIHTYVERNRMELDTKLGTALVDMYAKCGCIEIATRVFEDIPCKDVLACTSLISGLSNNGMSESAIELFRRMQSEGVAPNQVTFICVLSACSRMGFVDEGLEIFKSMKELYRIDPEIEHYGCMVDLLGRAGMLQEAEDIVKQMSTESDSYILGALLNACRIHGNIELGEEMVKRLAEQRLDYSGAHTLLSNIYASANRWDGVAIVRKGMEENQVRKVPGCSLIEVDGVVCEFGAGKNPYMGMDEITSCLVRMDMHLRSFWLKEDTKTNAKDT